MTYVYQKGHPAPITYPVTDLSVLTPGSALHSPQVGNPHGLPAPSMPGDQAFEDDLVEVLMVRMLVIGNQMPLDFFAKHHPRAGYDPAKVPEPFRAAGVKYRAANLVSAVHKDNPVDIGIICWRYLVATGATLRNPEGPHNNFLNRVPDTQAAIAENARDALRRAFEVKYYYGRPRPEEACARLGFGQNITGYQEGCPNHPAYPAGHASAAGAACVLFDWFNVTDTQRDAVFDACYVWAMARTMAGVHYSSDNLAGLALGGMGTYNGVTLDV